MYKKLEDKNMLGQYPAVIAFRHPDPQEQWDGIMSDEDLESVKSIAKSLEKGNSVLFKSGTNVCLACISEMHCIEVN